MNDGDCGAIGGSADGADGLAAAGAGVAGAAVVGAAVAVAVVGAVGLRVPRRPHERHANRPLIGGRRTY